MTKSFRRILFYLSLIIFLILGYTIVVFALGYKYDFTNNKLVKTGSFQVEANIVADVYINDVLAGKTSFISHNFSETFLLPRTYNVRLQSDGYYTWQKNIEINAGQLVEYPVIYLLPLKLPIITVASVSFVNNFSVRFDSNLDLAIATAGKKTEIINLLTGKLSSSSLGLAISMPKTVNPKNSINEINSPDGNKTLWFNNHEIWIRWLNNSNYQPFKKKDDVELVTRFAQTINDVQWYKDSSYLIADIGGILKFIETDTRGGINTLDIASIFSPFYFSNKNSVLYFFEKNKLYKINI